MKKNEKKSSKNKHSRRTFINTLGLSTAGLVLNPFKDTTFAAPQPNETEFLAQVAITETDNYERVNIRQRVAHLFESLGGISDIVKAGDKVGIKINLTGGSSNAYHERLQGVDVRETIWTHPEVLRAVSELLIENGVNGSDIYILEALWDDASYNNFGYLDVQNDLGANFIDLNKAPNNDFIDLEVGENQKFYSSFKVDPILNEIDVYVSISKMKHHYDAGVTHTIKNQVGMVPLQFYNNSGGASYRASLHTEGGNIRSHLPKSICDLNLARPVNLGIVDGVKSAVGGEGPWNPTLEPAEFHVLIAGKDPVATDSIASYIMGNDPEADTLLLPAGERCDNYLKMLSESGMGTNKMAEIELVGDGSGIIISVEHDYKHITPTEYMLFQNFPNPFNPSTTIKYYLPEAQNVTLKIFNSIGEEVGMLVNSFISAGQHEVTWVAKDLSSGVYLYRLDAGNFAETKKLILQK